MKANQEMVLRLTWMRAEMRRHCYLEVLEVVRPDVLGVLNNFKPVYLPSRELTDGKMSTKAMAKFPAKYIAKEVFEQSTGPNPVFVKWLSTEVSFVCFYRLRLQSQLTLS